jgi:hypothetical protein
MMSALSNQWGAELRFTFLREHEALGDLTLVRLARWYRASQLAGVALVFTLLVFVMLAAGRS